ncbi:hypothetical protein HPP92_025085 [Vanilla planifolia]|uniref:Uncharacterized protein n=1 Tax=Vanilla planifolia TaxID=51239 RepID=A0A835PF88_VANPL|nr:hypothetical protein HPP92_025355 [Vanilla planifolia]KAG0453781.1 hypothetical protein HPP92_025085 [Vanilla planifolia]
MIVTFLRPSLAAKLAPPTTSNKLIRSHRHQSQHTLVGGRGILQDGCGQELARLWPGQASAARRVAFARDYFWGDGTWWRQGAGSVDMNWARRSEEWREEQLRALRVCDLERESGLMKGGVWLRKLESDGRRI